MYYYDYILYIIIYIILLFNCFHLKKGLCSKRREFNNVILRVVSHVALLRCRLLYNQHYEPYVHTCIYIYI